MQVSRLRHMPRCAATSGLHHASGSPQVSRPGLRRFLVRPNVMNAVLLEPPSAECGFPSRRPAQSALFREDPQPECGFPSRRPAQSALFRRVRFSSPGQMSSRLTEKRSLRLLTHQKAHSVCGQGCVGFCGVRRVARPVRMPSPALLGGACPPEKTLLCPYPTTPWRIRQAPPS